MRQILLPSMALIVLIQGCWGGKPEPVEPYRTLAEDPRRDTQAARRHNAVAIGLLQRGELGQAEAKLKAALAADLFFGPAHNNLGTVYYRQKKYYLAAWEFQYAAKLMPSNPESRNNLGMVFEAVGRLDDAAEWYDKALTLAPDSVEILGNLARAYIRANRKDEKVWQLLSELAMKDSRPDWAAWAKERLALMGEPAPATTQPVK